MQQSANGGFKEIPSRAPQRVDAASTATVDPAAYLRSRALEHHAWRAESLNLCAAETITSHLVRELLASDFGRRYATRTGAYSGSRVSDEIEAWCEEAACRIFGCAFANVSPISGHIALLATLIALTKSGERVFTTDPAHGGYPLRIAKRIGIEVSHLPLEPDGLIVDVAATTELLERLRPSLVIFGASEFLFPAPLAELVPTCHELGSIVAYDAAHPFGLIAGGEFQQPFAHGIDIVFASTNKTFFGPHRGIVLVREDEVLHEQVAELLDSPPFFQSSHHVNTAVALAAAMAEMETFGRAYAAAVVSNAQALAHSLAESGVAVLGAERGYTRSHQVLLDCGGFGSGRAVELQRRLEEANILADLVVRFGTQQATRLGMSTAEMAVIANLIADIVHGTRPLGDVRRDVCSLASSFRRVHFCFDEPNDAFAYFELTEGGLSIPSDPRMTQQATAEGRT